LSPNIVTSVITPDKLNLTLTDTNFYTSDFNCRVSYAGVFATNVTVISSSEIRALFPSGVPLSNTAIAPVVYFTNSSTTTHFSQCAPSGNFSNALDTITGTS